MGITIVLKKIRLDSISIPDDLSVGPIPCTISGSKGKNHQLFPWKVVMGQFLFFTDSTLRRCSCGFKQLICCLEVIMRWKGGHIEWVHRAFDGRRRISLNDKTA